MDILESSWRAQRFIDDSVRFITKWRHMISNNETPCWLVREHSREKNMTDC
jgi:hypothetical protein